ncbi:MAG: hypothetical protein ACH344_08670 [Yersinia sp. (in: enterobacteria)]|jgi:hypothetical protein
MFSSPTNINPNTKNGTPAQYGDDSHVFVEFSLDAVLDQFKMDEEGIPVYNDVEMITITLPGDRVSTLVEKVTPEHRKRFKKQYDAWKEGSEAPIEGLPLTEWPVITKAQALNLKILKIFSVEQLAQLPDTRIDALGLGGRDLRDKAKAYLDRAVGAKEITQLFARIKKLEDESAAKDLRIEELENPKVNEKPETLKLKRA